MEPFQGTGRNKIGGVLRIWQTVQHCTQYCAQHGRCTVIHLSEMNVRNIANVELDFTFARNLFLG